MQELEKTIKEMQIKNNLKQTLDLLFEQTKEEFNNISEEAD